MNNGVQPSTGSSYSGKTFDEIAEDRKTEGLVPQGFHHENEPDDDGSDRQQHGRYCDQERSDDRDEVENHRGKFQCRRNEQQQRPKKQTLNGMKADKAVLLIRINQQKDDGGDERKVGKGSQNIRWQRPDSGIRVCACSGMNLGLCQRVARTGRLRRLRRDRADDGAAATGTETRGRRHLRGTVRT